MVTSLIDTLVGRIKRTPVDLRRTVEGNLGLAAVASSGQSRGAYTTTNVTGTDQKRFIMRIPGRSLRLQFNNYLMNGASPATQEVDTGNPITLKVSIVLATSISNASPLDPPFPSPGAAATPASSSRTAARPRCRTRSSWTSRRATTSTY
ncbi:hypothetical protein [Nocardioides zeae]